MRRLLMILPSVILLAACADAPPPEMGPVQQMHASFPPGGVVNVIRVDALDPLPLRTAELVAPDGTATPATSVDVQANPRTLGGQASLADPWRNSMLGTNGIDPLPTGAIAATPRAQSQLLLSVSTADVSLPDPVAYRQDWARYKIRLGFSGPGDTIENREIAAPAPPPIPGG